MSSDYGNIYFSLSGNLWPGMRYLQEEECFILSYGIRATAVTCDGSRDSVVDIVIRLPPV